MAWRTVSGEAAPVTVTVETPPDCRSMWTSLTWGTACTASVTWRAQCRQVIPATWETAEGLGVSSFSSRASTGAVEVVAEGVAGAQHPQPVETSGSKGGSRGGHRNTPSGQWNQVVS